MEVNTEKAVERAREVAYRKTVQQIPWPECVVERRMEFAIQAAKEFCNLVLPGGYAQLTDFPSDAKVDA
jgi:hypothetical protein